MIKVHREYDPNYDSNDEAYLDIQGQEQGIIEAYFIPSKNSLKEANDTSGEFDPDKPEDYKVKLLDISLNDNSLTIYPIITLGHMSDFLEPRYDQIKRIIFDDLNAMLSYSGDNAPNTINEITYILENLPSCFIKDFSYGLGITKYHRFIIDAVEELTDCTAIVIGNQNPTGEKISATSFYINSKDLEWLRKEINNIGTRSSKAGISVKEATAHNFFAEKIGLPVKEPKFGRHPQRKLFTKNAQGEEILTQEVQEEFVRILNTHKIDLIKEQNKKLIKLSSDIELVNLDRFIELYEQMLHKKSKQEKDWQELFNENPFLLSLAFSYPIIKIGEQISVGGRTLKGKKDKITDFLIKNRITSNCALIEIKTPKTKLLNAREYRGGVYGPSSDLTSSVNQVLDQKYNFEKEIVHIKDNSGYYDIKSYAIQCCLIIGKIPESDDQKKSFEIYRGNSKNVSIITFDELLEKLKSLRDFLKQDENSPSNIIDYPHKKEGKETESITVDKDNDYEENNKIHA